MAGQCSTEGTSTGNISAEYSNSTVQLNIKTLDSHIYSFQVDKNMPVLSFKEKIANEIGLPVSQQRLIFRGKVLKDEHVLSEYYIENGNTLHLVERQPNQSQAQGPGTISGETTSNRGNAIGSGAPHNHVRQISHSVVLGAFNTGDQVEGIVPDLTRVILNSIGIGGQSLPNASQPSSSVPPQNETEGMHAGNQNQAGNQARSEQASTGQAFQSLPQVVQIPLAAGAIPVPSLNASIPDSLNTLSEFINRMEQTLSQNGYQPNLSSTNSQDQPRVELPSNAQGLPTLEALSNVLHRAEQLLSGHAVAVLSHIAGRLEREGTTSDLIIRGQIQSESMQVGLAMQHLGAFLLELGRTILTLRMGQSSAESVVNAGPAVYISPSGPNPIMVQPFPLQTSSLFGGPVPPSTPATFSSVGVGSAPRNINIHIHAGTSLASIVSAIGPRANNGEETQSGLRNGPSSGDSGSTRVLPVGNVIAAALPSRPAGVEVASSTQTGFGVSTSQPPPDSVPLSSILAEINSRLRNFVGSMQGDNTVLPGQVESTSQDFSVGSESRPAQGNEQVDTMEMNGIGAAGVSSVVCSSENGVQKNQLQPEAVQSCNNEGRDVLGKKFVSTSSNQDSRSCSSGKTIAESEKVQEDGPSVSEKPDLTKPAKAAPLGLGVSGLEHKGRSRLQHPASKGADDGSTSSSANQNRQTQTGGQHILQTLASHGSAVHQRNANGPSQQPLPTGHNQIDVGGLMSQILHSPALNGLLAGYSQQTGVDPPGLRNILQQCTQNPHIMNTVNQMVQQVGSQDMGNMFAEMESGQGGGIDLSEMIQHMIPIVSEALGAGTPPQPSSAAEPEPRVPYREGTLGRDESSDNQSLQIDLQPVAERIEHQSPPADVLRAVAENAVQLSGSGSTSSDVLDELCSNESLASEYAEMLRHAVSRRVKGHSELDKS